MSPNEAFCYFSQRGSRWYSAERSCDHVLPVFQWSLKDISNQVNEDLLIQAWNGCLQPSTCLSTKSPSLSSASQSQPASVTSGLSSCQERKHTFCPLQLVASVCNWEPVIARMHRPRQEQWGGAETGDKEAGALPLWGLEGGKNHTAWGSHSISSVLS